MLKLGYYQLGENVKAPEFGTSLSSCFDLRYVPTQPTVNGYDVANNPVERFVGKGALIISPGERLLVPTGLVFKVFNYDSIETFADITRGEPTLRSLSIRLHARSGLALKRGLVLVNAEGIVDADYQQEVFVLMTNISSIIARVEVGERIAQGEVVKNEDVIFVHMNEFPEKYSERNGGFGSTGTA